MLKLKVHFLVLSIAVSCTLSNPIKGYLSITEDLDDDNYDIIIDQRQNGTQNFRIKVDGVSIAIPDEEIEHSRPSEMEIISLLGLQSSTPHSSTDKFSDDMTDFSEFATLFDLKKNLKSHDSKKELDDTQSRTKDLPTNSQIMGDTKDGVKAFVKKGGKKYKLLVGEKYIIPILQYLKKSIENIE